MNSNTTIVVPIHRYGNKLLSSVYPIAYFLFHKPSLAFLDLVAILRHATSIYCTLMKTAVDLDENGCNMINGTSN